MKENSNPYKNHPGVEQNQAVDPAQARISMNFFMRTGFVMNSFFCDEKQTSECRNQTNTQKFNKNTQPNRIYNLAEFAAQLANS